MSGLILLKSLSLKINMTERVTPFGVMYENLNLGVCEEAHPLNRHFLPDEEVSQRVEIDWPNTMDDGRQGWLVGTTSAVTIFHGTPIGEGNDLLVLDGEGHVDELHPKWVKKI